LFWCLEWTATSQFRVGFFVAPVFMLSGICTVAFSFSPSWSSFCSFCCLAQCSGLWSFVLFCIRFPEVWEV
jgi:hypothetical protein